MSEPLFYQDNHGNITQFTGELIASVSSALSVKDRHTEFDLFLTDDNIWVLQGIGRTKIETETDRYWVIVSKDVADVLQGIVGSDVSRLAKKLIALAITNLAGLDD